MANDVNTNFEKSRQVINDNNRQQTLNIARAACYSALSGPSDHALIIVTLENNSVDLNGKCGTAIINGWHAGGVANSNYYNQDCSVIDNLSAGACRFGSVSFPIDSSRSSIRNPSAKFVMFSPTEYCKGEYFFYKT